MMQADPRLILALDLPDVDKARAMADAVGEAVSFHKIGLQLLPIGGMDLAKTLKDQGKSVFLDFKLLDIAATVEKATRSIAGLGADLLTVHAETEAMKAAVAGRDDSALKLLGVTVLTSYDDAALAEIGYQRGAKELVLRRVDQAVAAGMDGIVASAKEAGEIAARVPDDFLIVTPGIRPAGVSADDQKRVATPASALKSGATHLVIGRAITSADDPKAAAEAILKEMRNA